MCMGEGGAYIECLILPNKCNIHETIHYTLFSTNNGHYNSIVLAAKDFLFKLSEKSVSDHQFALHIDICTRLI